jgi:ribosomal protein L11 methyltransferase
MVTDPIKHRPAKTWQKISITVDSRMADAVSACLTDLTKTGLEITTLENGRTSTDKTFSTEIITGYIATGIKDSEQHATQKKIEEIRKFIDRLQRIFPDSPLPILEVEAIIEEDWGKKWKNFFTSFHITPTLIIKPSWEDIKELDKEDETHKCVIEMDPGLAFGTGHHASTQLALLLLEEIFQPDAMKFKKALDVGTGSGILAMACGLYGAGEILAIDNDPDAVETAKQNIVRNHLENRISVSDQKVTSLGAGFDIIVANITHDILIELALPLVKLINAKGFLVLSGILKGEQEHSIRETYAKLGLEFIKNLTKDEWVALKFQNKKN